MVKNNIKLCRRFILHLKKIMKKPGAKCFVHSRVRLHLCQIKNLQLHNFTKTDQNTKNFVQVSFSIKLIKICRKTRGEVLAVNPI